MIVNEIGDLIFENFYKQSGFVKKAGIMQLNAWRKIFAIAYNQINGKNSWS